MTGRNPQANAKGVVLELDGAALTAIGTSLVGTAGAAWGGVKWVCARVDKQFAEAEAKSEKVRQEIKAELDECDAKHEKCESDRLKIWEEVIGLRAEVKLVVRSQGTNAADIKTLKDHQAEGPR
jgi:hypothetical protein